MTVSSVTSPVSDMPNSGTHLAASCSVDRSSTMFDPLVVMRTT
eukprot:CAMPEP_0116865228 /NCGR_PEP_ID=MMETSP0418-20121206/25287_1 /TAXON_ID=1158023 /ORGANISM="Astrosyne radiata, Strain 13vi08-1A" /LENGTH=42 /DNA_ID= /DNA_START= /DNA_END= /DNA_ORIENTATION=